MERAVVRDSERGRDDRVLRGCVDHRHHHLLGEPEPVHQRAVHLRQRAQTERVLDPSRHRIVVDERTHRLAHPCCAGERSRHLDRWAERLRVAADRGVAHRRDDHQAARELVDVSNRQGGVGQHGGVARHEGECVAGNERGGAWHRRVARLLTGQHQRCGGERCQVRRTDAAALAHRRQRVLGDHVGQRFQDRRMQAIAIGGELVEPDEKHRPHSLCRSWVTRAGRVRAQQL